MKAVRDEALEGRLRYVCTNCDDDPLHDPTARKWARARCVRRRNEHDQRAPSRMSSGRLAARAARAPVTKASICRQFGEARLPIVFTAFTISAGS